MGESHCSDPSSPCLPLIGDEEVRKGSINRKVYPSEECPHDEQSCIHLDCRSEAVADERELVRRDASDEMQLSEMTPAEHACSVVRLSNVGKLPWTAGKGSEKLSSKSSTERSVSNE